MSVLWKKTKLTNGKSNLEAMQAGGVTLERPTVIFLTGVSTTMSQPKFVSGAISHLNDMMNSFGENNSENTDVFAWSYASKRSNFKSMFAYNAMPNDYASKHAVKFVNDFLLPHIADDVVLDKKGYLQSGKKKSVKEVNNAFQNLTLIAYSFGSVFSQEIYNALNDTMKTLGYSKSNTRFLISRIHQISLGAVSRPMQEDNRYTSVCLVATNDAISNHKRRLYWSFKELSAAYTKKLSIRKLSKRSWYISAPVQKELWEQNQDEDGNIVMRNVVRPLFPKWWVRHSHHELPHYTTDQHESNQFAKIARFALINSIQRTRALRPDEMIAPPKCILGKDAKIDSECEAYQKRIKSAFRK